MKYIDPQKTQMHLSCRVIRHILLYFGEHYGRDELYNFIEQTGMSLDYLEDGNNWISYQYFNNVLNALVEYTGDINVPYKAGAYAIFDMAWGPLEIICKILRNVGFIYKSLVKYSSLFSKNSRWVIEDKGRNWAIIKFIPLLHFPQTKNNCKNIKGQLASFPNILGLPNACIKEVQCAAEGADSCIYEINWINKSYRRVGLFTLLLGIVNTLVIYILISLEIIDLSMLSKAAFIIIPVGFFLCGMILDDRKTLKDNIEVIEEQNDTLVDMLINIEKLKESLQKKVVERSEELRRSNERLLKTYTELRSNESQMIQSEKMAAVGRLAVRLAHELNGPVSAIQSCLHDAIDETMLIGEGDSCEERLIKAVKAADRCENIVNDLLSFSNNIGDTSLVLVDINDILEKCIVNAEEEISNPYKIIIKDLTQVLPKIKADSMLLQQVFMNIIMNASDAIKGKGQIIIKTEMVEDSVLARIFNNGEEIPKENMNKVFDPFFTTKAPGKSKGLGLAISYNIIKRFNGDIRVQSKPGKGTMFTVTIPLFVERSSET
ncbi:MAG: HAMP domain-containing sensor histidine kinase [Spirochaetota bacterium]|nr:HAMP domain-containing sensor histidine kinase [Spirochaetota bacterium]